MSSNKLIKVQCSVCLEWRTITDPGPHSRMPKLCRVCSRHGRRPSGPHKRIRQCSRCGVLEGGEILHEVLSEVDGKLLCQECIARTVRA